MATMLNHVIRRAALVAVLAALLTAAACTPAPRARLANTGMDPATACDVLISHLELSEPVDTATAWDVARAWLHSGNDDLHRAALVLFDGTPSVVQAWPYIKAGCDVD